EIIIVKPGQKIALDGIIITGDSNINQANITGESIPVYKGPGDEVFAGTLNIDGLLEIKVTTINTDTMMAKIIRLAEKAQTEKTPLETFINKFARYYTPLIILFSICMMLAPPLIWAQDWYTWIYRGLSLLVVGCPCALILSTPIAVATTLGIAAKHGVLVK